MEFLYAFEHFTGSHVWIAATIICAFFFWIIIKRRILSGSYLEGSLGLIAVVDLALFPLAILSAGGLLYYTIQGSDSPTMEKEVRFFAQLLAVLSVAWCLARFAELRILSKSKRDDIESYLPGLQRGLMFGGALFIGLAVFLNYKGYSITGLYVSTGAVAALIAFAMQRTLGDLFSGIALSIDSPFRLGDWLELEDGSQGQVIDISWRSTRFRTWDKATLIVPNSELARQGIKNLHGKTHVFAPWYEIKLPGDLDPRFAKALLLEAALRCNNTLKKPLPSVRLVDASTVPYTYMIWVHFKNFPAMFAGREELFREIHYGLKMAGVHVVPDAHEIHTRRAEVMSVEPPTTLLALKSLDVANVLNESELEHLAQMSRYHTADAGSVLLKEGDIANTFDIITAGIVESSLTTKSGATKVVDQLKPGQYFGITSMIIDNPSFLQFTALTDVTMIRLDLECFREILSGRPDLSNELAKIVQQRMEAAHEARLLANVPAKKLHFSDILKRIDTLLK
ncbi:MAG: mechanosensitive ion channel domain-containing protein [Rhizobiaceae bacterium]